MPSVPPQNDEPHIRPEAKEGAAGKRKDIFVRARPEARKALITLDHEKMLQDSMIEAVSMTC
jgi:hypothetical protein